MELLNEKLSKKYHITIEIIKFNNEKNKAIIKNKEFKFCVFGCWEVEIPFHLFKYLIIDIQFKLKFVIDELFSLLLTKLKSIVKIINTPIKGIKIKNKIGFMIINDKLNTLINKTINKKIKFIIFFYNFLNINFINFFNLLTEVAYLI